MLTSAVRCIARRAPLACVRCAAASPVPRRTRVASHCSNKGILTGLGAECSCALRELASARRLCAAPPDGARALRPAISAGRRSMSLGPEFSAESPRKPESGSIGKSIAKTGSCRPINVPEWSPLSTAAARGARCAGARVRELPPPSAHGLRRRCASGAARRAEGPAPPARRWPRASRAAAEAAAARRRRASRNRRSPGARSPLTANVTQRPVRRSIVSVPSGTSTWKVFASIPAFSFTSLKRTEVRLPNRSTTTDSRSW
jgi:hypothetical protein